MPPPAPKTGRSLLQDLGLPTADLNPFFGELVEGRPVERRSDPNLKAKGLSEQIYRFLAEDDVVASAWRQVSGGATGPGFRVEKGSSGTTAADGLADLARAFLDSGRVQAVLSPLAEDIESCVVACGWGPVQTTWEPAWIFGGVSYLVPVWARLEDSWRHALTAKVSEEPQRLIVRSQTFGTGRLLTPQEQLRWFVFRYGSAETYGKSAFRSILNLWLAKREMDALIAPAGQRALGVLKAALRGEAEEKPDAIEVAAKLRGIVEDLRQWGILYAQDFDFQAMEIETISDFLQVVDHLIGRIAIGILTVNLTREVKEGSFAAATVQEGVKEKLVCRIGEFMARYWTEIVQRFIQLNHSQSIPESDLPRVVARVAVQPTAAEVQAGFNLGIPLDGHAIARQLKLPVAIPADQPFVIQKPAGLSLESLLTPPTKSSPARGHRVAGALDDPGQAASLLDELFEDSAGRDHAPPAALATRLAQAWVGLNQEAVSVPLSRRQRS